MFLRLSTLPPGTRILHGGARGADELAGRAAHALDLPATVFRPDWRRYGGRAGILRNLAMLDEGPELVIAFWDGSSPGTRHTIEEARRRGIPVEIVGPA